MGLLLGLERFALEGLKKLIGNAQPGDVLSGKTFSNAEGNDKVGTMPNRGAVTITPSTVDQAIPAGYHNGQGKVIGDPDLIPANIRSGINIFGVAGTLVEGKRWAAGAYYLGPGGQGPVSVRGLAFRPAIVLVSGSNSAYNNRLGLSIYTDYTKYGLAIGCLSTTYFSGGEVDFDSYSTTGLNIVIYDNGFDAPIRNSSTNYIDYRYWWACE